MQTRRDIRRHSDRNSESGYVLLTFLLMATLMLIALAMVAPVLKTQVKREREEELIHRGHQYVVAVRRYYKKFGRYPTKLEDLQNTNNMRFLRKAYKDPMTANGEFRLIRYGQAKTQPLGLFGQAAGQPGLNAAAQAAQAAAQGTSQGFSLSLPNPQSSTSGSFGTPIGTPAGGTGIAGATSNPGTPASSLGTLQPGGATFGGGPIIGVASNSEAESLKERRGKTHYNEWEFVYDPRYDPTNRVSAGVNAGAAATQQQNQPNTSPFGTSPFGTSGTFGSTPGMPGPTPTPPPTPTPTPAPNQ
ncbi:MAG: type II secretion system protein [Acidobacteriaceae bacterium]|nr:type II secretion system protein [Acidobacteriaceae bacterium]